MGRPLFTEAELLPKTKKIAPIKASTNLNGVLRIQPKPGSVDALKAGFQRAINRASERIAVDLKAALDDALRSGGWPVPGGTADIYDTGELLRSGVVEITEQGVTIAYSAPYAALVHYGGYINPYGNTSTRVYLPPRPWVDAVLNGGGPVQAFDFLRYYGEEIEAEFK